MIQKFLCTSKNKGTLPLVDLLIQENRLLVLEALGLVLGSSGSGHGLVSRCFKHGKRNLCSMKCGEFPERLRNCWPLKKKGFAG